MVKVGYVRELTPGTAVSNDRRIMWITCHKHKGSFIALRNFVALPAVNDVHPQLEVQ